MDQNSTRQIIEIVCDSIKEMLLEKNKSYGDSAISPIRIFSKSSSDEQLNVRLDDKLSRIAKGTDYGQEDTELDIIGYLILKRVSRKIKEEIKKWNII